MHSISDDLICTSIHLISNHAAMNTRDATPDQPIVGSTDADISAEVGGSKHERRRSSTNTKVPDGFDDLSNINSSAIALQSDDHHLPSVILRMPNTAYGIPMGLAGHAIMWRSTRNAEFVNSSTVVETVDILNSICWYSSCVVAGFVTICYVYKAFTSFLLVKNEYLNQVRCHFFHAPNLICIMLLLGLPVKIAVPNQTLRILWGITFCCQILMTQFIYKAWMFSERRNFTEAKPQFLLSIVGWFLLASLGQSCQIREEWGIGLPQMCFGAGFILYIDITIFIFTKLHENKGLKGSPAMFLLIAPPSVGVVALDLFDNDSSEFSLSAEMLLGWVFVLLLLLFRLGPVLWKNPAVLGEYWAYVFPLASATSATIQYASALQTTSTEVLAIAMIVVAILSLLLVFSRMTFHMYRCLRRQAQWKDPIFDADKYRSR